MKQLSARLLALLCTAALSCTALAGCSKKEESRPAPTEAKEVSAAEEQPEEQPAETATPEEEETAHISPRETVTSVMGAQVDISAVLHRDSETDEGKNCKIPLSGLIREGDMVDSFTFVFYAQDGVSNIGTYKGGCGISVTEDCAAATDPGWYQSGDFSAQTQGAYAEVTWQVPSEIRSYISAGGDVQIGYWWGNTEAIELRNVICSYTRTADLPVDGTQTIDVKQTVPMDGEVSVPLAEVLGEDGVPQAITFDISAGQGFGKFTGGFGINTSDWYQSETIAVLTGASDLSLTWILPEEIKSTIPQNAEVKLGYWWGDPASLTLNSVTVKYSSGLGTGESYTPPAPAENTPASQDPKPVSTDGQAAEIAAAIKAGWCLGNTLDCYDKKAMTRDMETYWGNPKTTKAMIDTVKAQGFNAIRIPVSWTNHLDDANNIDAAWMDRVQEVVDYAMDGSTYVILNMHHDDYTWLHPVYAEEEAVTAKYLHIWEQIADRFKDYDTHLLFEGLNEPRMVGSATEWTGGTAEEHDVINHLLQKFVTLVRDSGGNNASRTLVVTTHAASITDTALNGLVLPQDKNLIVSIHNYAPWKFTDGAFPKVNSFDDSARRELDADFDKLYNKFISKGVPVIIGEFGAVNKSNDADRTAYYGYYITAARQRGIPCFIWDNGLSSEYGLLDRKGDSWYFQGIMDSIADAAK